MRFGTPSSEVHCELNESSWGSLLKAVADGEPFDLKFKRGYGIVVSVMLPPFPYAPKVFDGSRIETSTGVNLLFREDTTDDDMERIHFEEFSLACDPDSVSRYVVAGKHGYALYVTGHGNSVEEARKQAYAVIDKLILPKMFYRTDIGEKFIHNEQQKLKYWGWLP